MISNDKMPLSRNVIDALLAAVDEDALLNDSIELVRRSSVNPPGDESPVAVWLAERCKTLGLDVATKEILPNRPNVIARLQSSTAGPTVVWNGHTDVVPPGSGWSLDPFGGIVRDGRLYGRGAADMKGAIAGALAAVRALKTLAMPLRGSLILTFVIDEEASQAGTRALVTDGLKADCAIVGEPTSLVPVLAQKGSMRFEITTQGRAAHASVPDRGVNAIYLMARVLKRLELYNEELRAKNHRLLGSPTVSVGTIDGGIATPLVADTCRITISRRTIGSEQLSEPDDELRALLADLVRDDPQFRAELRRTMHCPASEIAEHEPIAQLARWATSTVLRRDVGFEGWPANCDATFLVNDLRIPTIILGPGDLFGGPHQADESISLEQLLQGAQVYVLLFARLLGADGSSVGIR